MRLRFGLALFLLALSFSSIVQGQISNVTGETQTPMPGTGRDYLHELTETIDPSTGALNLNISVSVPPGRKLTVPFAFTYNSNSAWHMETVSALGAPGPHYESGILQLGGWSYRIPSLSRQQVLTYPAPAIQVILPDVAQRRATYLPILQEDGTRSASVTSTTTRRHMRKSEDRAMFIARQVRCPLPLPTGSIRLRSWAESRRISIQIQIPTERP